MEQKQKIKKTKEYVLQNAFEAAQIGLWYWDTESDELIINDAWARTIGYLPEELSSFNTPHWFNLCHPDDRDAISENLKNFVRSDKKYFTFRSRLKHKNGHWVWTQFNGGISENDPFGNPKALSGTLTDISELYQSKNNLHYRYEIEKLVSEISSDFVGIQAQNTDLVINQSIEKIGQFLDVDRCYIFQFEKNNTAMDNTHEWCGEGITQEIHNLQNLPTSLFPWWMKKMNKLEHIYIRQIKDLPSEAAVEKELLRSQSITSLLVVPIHYQKNLLGFIGFDSVRKEKEWHEADIHLISMVAHTIANAFNSRIYQEILIQAKEKAEESEQIKSAFLATINHELRTPLHHILGFSELLKMNKIPVQEISGFADKIYNSGRNLLQIIEDILNLALADDSYVQARQEHFNGMDMFLQHKMLLNKMLKSSNKEKNIRILYSPSPAFISDHFFGDNGKINQIIVNLFKNAIKFTKSGSIEYKVDSNKNILTFQIKDSGIGIPQHQQKLIFDFFRQADSSSTRVYSGIGVGLSISKRITKILGGELSVRSIPGKGSTFTLSVPIEREAVSREKTPGI